MLMARPSGSGVARSGHRGGSAPRGLRAKTCDVVVVGGGPAGAVTAWSLARRGVRVAVLEREHFPREKVCGDFVEPRGLRIMEDMGCRAALESMSPLPITHVAVFLESDVGYRSSIPFYGSRPELPPHGYIVPRSQLDTLLLDCARKAGATVHEGCAVTEIDRDGKYLKAWIGGGRRRSSIRARLIVGADGTRSVVARRFRLLNDDPRYIAVSQRAYAENARVEMGEAAFFFDRDLFPGYGWMFPMTGGRANIGVGILSETRDRYAISVPELFRAFVEKLRQRHPGCAEIRIPGKPLGGIVRTYGGAGRNYFAGGVLVGDAGCFVDPMTGEGITPAAESGLIASSTIVQALERGVTDARHLAGYERDFRAYFDPAMRYLDLCATMMRNRHLCEFWLNVTRHGCAQAAADPDFARITGSTFGGMEVRPSAILAQLWSRMAKDVGAAGAQGLLELLKGRVVLPKGWIAELGTLQNGWWRSLLDDPVWHSAWTADVLQKWTRMLTGLRTSGDPRLRGPALP